MNPVEEYIFSKDCTARETLLLIRELIINSDSDITEKISYKIPYFYRNKPLCYLNPKPNGIDIGFSSGYKFKNSSHLLIKNERKIVRSYFVEYNCELKQNELNEILKEAIEVDDLN